MQIKDVNLDEAQRRYLMDPVFSMKVKAVVQALDQDLYAGTGCHLNGDDRSLATLAAAAGVLYAEVTA